MSVAGRGDDHQVSFFIHDLHGVHAGGRDWSWSYVGGLWDAEQLTEDIWHALPDLALADVDTPSPLSRTARLIGMAYELLSMDVSAAWTLRQARDDRVDDLLSQTNAATSWNREGSDAAPRSSPDDLWFLFKDQWVLGAFDLSRFRVATPELAWDLARDGMPQHTLTQSVAEIFEEWLQ